MKHLLLSAPAQHNMRSPTDREKNYRSAQPVPVAPYKYNMTIRKTFNKTTVI